MAKLTSTTYALLGLLSKRPWSAYELAKYMQHSAIRVVWPRAESGIFKEPKKLVAEGLATVRHEQVNNRLRAVYAITDAGRIALEQWLVLPSQPATIEHESMLKLLQMNFEHPGELQEKIKQMAQEAREQQLVIKKSMQNIVSKGFTIEGRGIQNVLANIFTQEMNRALLDWTTSAQQIVDEIPEGMDERESDEWALKRYDKLLDDGPLQSQSDE